MADDGSDSESPPSLVGASSADDDDGRREAEARDREQTRRQLQRELHKSKIRVANALAIMENVNDDVAYHIFGRIVHGIIVPSFLEAFYPALIVTRSTFRHRQPPVLLAPPPHMRIIADEARYRYYMAALTEDMKAFYRARFAHHPFSCRFLVSDRYTLVLDTRFFSGRGAPCWQSGLLDDYSSNDGDSGIMMEEVD